MDLVKDFVKKFKKESTLVLIDPAMADGGKMYPGFDLEFAKKMAGLVAMADITVPNLTEACFMLGIDYPKSISCKATSMSDKAKDKIKHIIPRQNGMM